LSQSFTERRHVRKSAEVISWQHLSKADMFRALGSRCSGLDVATACCNAMMAASGMTRVFLAGARRLDVVENLGLVGVAIALRSVGHCAMLEGRQVRVS